MQLLRNPTFGLIAALLLGAGIWLYFQRVLIPYQVRESAAHAIPRGNLSDLYPRWLGARELLLRGRDPYSAEVTREIQTGTYGRPLDPSLPADPKDQQRFAYPVYVALLLAPSVKLSFSVLQTIFRWLLAAMVVATAWLWLRFVQWHLTGRALGIVVVLALGSLASVQGIKLQQLSLLVSALIAASAVQLAAGQLFLAGVLLALATIKPQLVLLPAAWLLLWTFADWKRRQNFAWGFLLSVAALVAGGEYLLPGWIAEFAAAIVAYRHYTASSPVLVEFLGNVGGLALNMIALVVTFIVAWRLKTASAKSSSFTLVTALALAVNVLVDPTTATYNQIFLLPAILLIARYWTHFWTQNALTRIIYLIATLLFLWPWLAAVILVLASTALPLPSVEKAWAVPLWTSLAIPVLVACLLIPLVSGELRNPQDSSAV